MIPLMPGEALSIPNVVFQSIGILIDVFVIWYLTRLRMRSLFVGGEANEAAPWEGTVRKEPHF